MTEKVLLTQEQADRIEFVKLDDRRFNLVLDTKLNDGFTDAINLCLNELSARDIATALLVGYEVKEGGF